MNLQGLQAKSTAMVVVVLTPLFALTAWVLVGQVNEVLTAQASDMTRDQSLVVAEAQQTFGKIGSADGLEWFLTKVAKGVTDISVRATRAPSTATAFGARASSPELDSLEREVLASGEPRDVRLPEEHVTRFVVPILNAADCVECHTEVPEGAVLGTSSVAFHTTEADNAQSRILWTIAGMLGATLLIAVLLLTLGLKYVIVRPIRQLKDVADRLAEGDVDGAAKAIDGGKPPSPR